MINIGKIEVKHTAKVQGRALDAIALSTDDFTVRLSVNGNELFSFPAEDIPEIMSLLGDTLRDVKKSEDFLSAFPCALAEAH